MRNIIQNLVVFTLLCALCQSCLIDKTEDPASISGVVKDSSGKGIAGVKVKLESLSVSPATETSSTGHYVLNIPSGGATAYIAFSKEGYTPLSQAATFRAGDNLTVDITLNALSEDAFFVVESKDDVQLKNGSGHYSILVKTNINFEVECDADWLDIKKTNGSITFDYSENETLEKRTAIINFSAEYNFTRTIKIEQDEGPVLELTDYLGKDNATNYLTSIPFISFNREVNLISSIASPQGVDLSPQYSADRKTIYFPNIKLSPFSAMKVSYVVESTDKATVKGYIELQPYEKSISTSGYWEHSIRFIKDNKHFWMRMSGYDGVVLDQYSLGDLTKTASIGWDKEGYGYTEFYYNAYNNSLYVFIKNKLDIYDASSGKFIKQIDLSSVIDPEYITDVAFGNNGYGLCIAWSNGKPKILYIDSANNHKCGVFSEDDMFYDPHHTNTLIVNRIEACDNGKTLVLSKGSEINDIFTVDITSKNIVHYSLYGQYFSANYYFPGVFLGGTYNRNASYIDSSSGNITKQSANSLGNSAVFLHSENNLPIMLTSELSRIDMKSGEEIKTADVSNISSIHSSNDGKSVIIEKDYKVYLFNSDLFLKYTSKIK